MDTVFVFTRPFTRRFTAQYAKASGDFRFIRVSDFKFGDDVGLIGRMYRRLRHKDGVRVSGLDYEAVARRCRYLRLLDADLQRRIIDAMWLAIDEVCSLHGPVAFIGLPMDNYVLDLFDQYCTANGIFTTNPVQSFLPDRTRITRRGEHVTVRMPDDDEVAHYRELLLQRNFRPTWLSKRRTTARLAKMLIREIAKVALFKSIKGLTRDPYSFHNVVAPLEPLEKRSGPITIHIRVFLDNEQHIVRRVRQYLVEQFAVAAEPAIHDVVVQRAFRRKL